jgi:hypothetical protein
MLISLNRFPPYSNLYNSPLRNSRQWEHSSPVQHLKMYLSKMNPIAILLIIGWAAIMADMVL